MLVERVLWESDILNNYKWLIIFANNLILLTVLFFSVNFSIFPYFVFEVLILLTICNLFNIGLIYFIKRKLVKINIIKIIIYIYYFINLIISICFMIYFILAINKGGWGVFGGTIFYIFTLINISSIISGIIFIISKSTRKTPADNTL
jgi:hypothetical protein